LLCKISHGKIILETENKGFEIYRNHLEIIYFFVRDMLSVSFKVKKKKKNVTDCPKARTRKEKK
jgi:hypothetical protein